ncbi:hypothetical protein NYO98_10350 [Nocardioides sp. STR2]|uniref:Hemolysin-type calcium-binding repeat-containing protein n=1 Tax=Nocardioides pini TaxID=2975053 RepID=A0ABT4CCK0_9ACTN|nr:hypothetical protein [Nocardioides pini]MCY4726678.1 hypothetical protein [Nocardioides pini]
MRLTLTAAAVMGAALLVPMGTATAAAETCDGKAATIVGTPGGTITGTEGPDVIVTNGATRVDALGGDDLVCATGDATVGAFLGEGADTFLDQGGKGHGVIGGTADGIDTEADVIRLASWGTVRSGTPGQPNGDTIDLAAGGDLFWSGTQTAPGSVTTTGGGLFLRGQTEVTVDASGTVTGPDTSFAYTGRFDWFHLTTRAEAGTFTFRGTDHDENVVVDAPTTFDRHVTLGDGDDTYETNGLGGNASWAKGNEGEDRLLLNLSGHRVKADLGRKVTAADGQTLTRIRGFEDYVMSARRVKVRGTNRGERLSLIACRTFVNAGPGKDVITHSVEYGEGDEWTTPRCKNYRAVVNGGRGRDTIKGTPGNDRLIGGRGFDTIDGDFGRDVCEGESKRRCERRP